VSAEPGAGQGAVIEYGPLWDVNNEAILKRTIAALTAYFDIIRSEATALWDLGSGEGGGLAMNDGITICINGLRSIFHHFQISKRISLGTLDNSELIEVIAPWARIVGKHFSTMTSEQMIQFRALRGVQGQTTGTRRLEESIQKVQPAFDPPGLKEFLEREKAQTTARAYEVIKAIEQVLQTTVLGELKNEFGANEEDWWFSGVPKGVRKKVDDRINEEAGKSGGREQNFDFIDYREIMHSNWNLFESALGRGKGSRENRTKWIVEVNDLRKRVMHASKGQSLPITEEQLALLEDIYHWLESQVGSQQDN
jgi:DNA sulfur modification protein DndB